MTEVKEEVNELDVFFGKGTKVTVEGVEVDIPPLNCDSLGIMLDLGDPKKREYCFKRMVYETLRTNERFKNIKMSNVDVMSLKSYRMFIEPIMKVNGLEPTKKELEEAQKKGLFGDKDVKQS